MMVAVLALSMLAGCGSTKTTGSVATDGSTSMEKVIGALGEAFQNETGISFTYNSTGSGSGIKAVQEGRCDIGLSSRTLKDEEKASGLSGTVLAYDGIAIIVIPENPVADLSVETIAAIYTGEITNWSEVGGKDAEIVLIGREAGSGTRDGFESTPVPRMRDYQKEFENRVSFIRGLLAESGADGIVYGNSGGKDSALVGILCKAACNNTIGIIMPCASKRNYNQDAEDGLTVAKQYRIETRTVDLTPVREIAIQQLSAAADLNSAALTNLAPRLRMLTLYAVAASENRLVAGTGNRSEAYVGYFTKWGDGAHDFNPVSDLTVTEIYEFLHWLNAPACIIKKAPSAGLFDGQTDELEMGITYNELDAYLFGETVSDTAKQSIQRMHDKSEHKREGIKHYA